MDFDHATAPLAGSPNAPTVGLFGILLIYAIGIFGMLVISMAVPTLHAIAGEFHPDRAALVGLFMSMPALAAVLGSLLVGALVDRYGDRPVMLLGAALVVASDAGVVAAPSFAVLLAWRALGGLGYVGIVVGAVAMIGRLSRGRQRTLALALWSTVIPASFVLAALYGLLRGGAPWRVTFVSHGLATTVLALLVMLVLPPRVGATASRRLAGLGAVLRGAGPWRLGLSFAGAAFLQTGFVALLPSLLAARIGLGEATIHAFTLPAMACNIAGAFGFGALHARGVRAVGPGLAATALALVAATLLIAAPGSAGRALALECALMAGLGVLVGMWALLPAIVPDPDSYGATSGMITQITLLGVLFGPPAAFAAIALGTAGALAFVATGAALALIGLPVWNLRPAWKQRRAD